MTTRETENRRESWIWGGWNLADDDAPRIPEPDVMSSAQARRAWRNDRKADDRRSVSF